MSNEKKEASPERREAWKTHAQDRRDRIVANGGRRITLLLDAEATQALDYLIQRQELMKRKTSALAMVTRALVREAKRQGM